MNCRLFLDLTSNRNGRIICAYHCLQETNILLKCTLKQVVQYILSLTQSSGLAWVRIPEHNNIAGLRLTSCADFRKIILVKAKEYVMKNHQQLESVEHGLNDVVGVVKHDL